MTTSPDSGKRPRGVAGMKQKYEDQLAERQSRIQELEARLARQEMQEAAGITIAPPSPKPFNFDADTVEVEYDRYNSASGETERVIAHVPAGYPWKEDPLFWIRFEDRIGIVQRGNAFIPGRTQLRRRGDPVDAYMSDLKRLRYGTWEYFPFKIEGRNQQETQELQLAFQEFNHFLVDRTYAERVFAKERNPFPKKSIVRVADYQGLWDHDSSPKGVESVSSGDPLTEYVRHWLQAFAGRIWGNHGVNRQWDPARPNPYSDKLAGARFQPIAIINPDKDYSEAVRSRF